MLINDIGSGSMVHFKFLNGRVCFSIILKQVDTLRKLADINLLPPEIQIRINYLPCKFSICTFGLGL